MRRKPLPGQLVLDALASLGRFNQKVRVLESGCWEWTGARKTARHFGDQPYGNFRDGSGKVVSAHLYAYRTLIGPLPKGTEVDHTCRFRLCVNPWHLEPVTHSENMKRAAPHQVPDFFAAKARKRWTTA